MNWSRCFSSSSFSAILFLFLFILTCPSASAASAFISDGIFGSPASSGRHLLQAKKACPVNFEFLNYTVITSQCKGPLYLPSLCCPAFKQFACPYAEDLNDLTNDCATTMFSYINLYGKYPPGLFASECREGKEGLLCSAPSPTESANDSNGSQMVCHSFPLLVLTAAFLVLLLQLF